MIGYLSQTGMESVFRQWAQSDPNINSFGFGQFYNVNGEPRASQKYAGMWVQPSSTSVDEWTIRRSYQIMIYDLVFEDESGGNQNSVVSDCEEIGFRLIRFLRGKSEIFNVVGSPTITPLSDQFFDRVSGVLVDIEVEFNGESSDCNDPDYNFNITQNDI